MGHDTHHHGHRYRPSLLQLLQKRRHGRRREGEEGCRWPANPLWVPKLRKEKGKGGGSPLASHHLVHRPCALSSALAPPALAKEKTR
jgi:hypothetical protein